MPEKNCIPLKTGALIADVGAAAPLMFDVTAVIIIEDVGVAEAEVKVEFEAVGTTDNDPDPDPEALVRLVVESPAPFPELLPLDCVGLLGCVVEASVIVDVVGPFLLCICKARGFATAIAMQR